MPNGVFASHRMKFVQLFFITVIALSIVAVFESSTTTNAQSDATATPIEPTVADVQPTEIPVEATSVPAEATVVPLEPTTVPVEPIVTTASVEVIEPLQPTATIQTIDPLPIQDTQITGESLGGVELLSSTTSTVATSLHDFAVFGTNGVVLQKTDTVNSGFIGSYEDIMMADEITVAPASLVFAPALDIRGATRVQTAYFTSLNNNSAVVNHNPFPTTPLVTFPPAPAVTPGSQNVDVPASASQTLAAGSYNDLLVQSSGTLVLSGGVYHFNNITLQRNAQLRFTGMTEIRVSNRIYADDYSVIAPQTGTAVTPNQILVGVYRANAADTETPVAEFKGGNIVSATIYVPNGLLDFSGNDQLTGAFIGKWVYMGTLSQISLASYFANDTTTPPVSLPTATPIPPLPPTALPTLAPTTVPTTVPTTAPTIAPTLETVTTSTGTGLHNFAVFGTNGVSLQKTDRVNSGYVGSNEDIMMADQMTVADASLVFAPALDIRGSTVVQTAYFTNLNNNNAVVHHNAFPTTPLVTFPAAPSVTPGSQNISVSSNQSLAAGSYRDLTVSSGRTLVLTGGVYHFNTITLQRDAQIRFTAATEVRVATRIYGDSRSVIAPQTGTAVTPNQILIGVYRANAAETETPVAEFRSSNIILANIYVPNGILDFGGRVQLNGSFIGKWVTIGVESQISLSSYFANTTTIPETLPTALPPATLIPTATSVPPTAVPVQPTSVPPTATPVTTTGSVFYVSRNGNNGDGRSWATAWNEFSRIDWTQIRAGSIIYIDGGSTSMMYQTTLSIGASGQAGQPIRIQRSTEAGRNGRVVMFGGRTTGLPYCGQPTYDDSGSANFREYGIHTNNHRFVTIDGMGWRGIEIHGFTRTGMRIERYSTDITVRNVEIRNNGRAYISSGAWRSDHPGVILAGVNTTFQRAIIHDNGADAFQSMWDNNNISNFRLEQSWLYNSRPHPTVTGESFNYCTHSDGIQLYDGGVISGITVTETIFGPGFTQNLMFGEILNSNGSWADIQNVTFRDVIFSRGADNGVHNKHNTNSSNWTLERVTIDCTGTKYNCLHIDNSNHTVRDSVVVNGLIWLHDGLNTYSGNCTWNTSGFGLGQSVNPSFVSFHSSDMFALNDYTVRASGCTGSRLTSVNQLLSMP